LVLIISFLLITKNKKIEIKDNPLQQEESMTIKEPLQGSEVYSFNVASSKINWEGKKTLIKEWVDTGNISIQSGSVTLVDDKIIEGRIIIDMNSITAQKTGAGEGETNLSKHLKSADFFNVEIFPTSQFILTSIIPSEKENEYLAKGDITIKNITKNIEFPMNIYMTNGSISMNAKIILDRTLFDVRFGSTNFFKDIGDKAIDNNFTLKLELIANK
jgi:polyisoprenoid-binding protein YceI